MRRKGKEGTISPGAQRVHRVADGAPRKSGVLPRCLPGRYVLLRASGCVDVDLDARARSCEEQLLPFVNLVYGLARTTCPSLEPATVTQLTGCFKLLEPQQENLRTCLPSPAHRQTWGRRRWGFATTGGTSKPGGYQGVRQCRGGRRGDLQKRRVMSEERVATNLNVSRSSSQLLRTRPLSSPTGSEVPLAPFQSNEHFQSCRQEARLAATADRNRKG